MFVIGGNENTCVVNDSCSKKFSLMKSTAKSFKINFVNVALAIYSFWVMKLLYLISTQDQ